MILVTGATGFIGPHVVRRLGGVPGRPRIRALLRRPDERFSTRFPEVEVVVGDLLDGNAVRAAVADVAVVIHLASKNIDSDGSGFDVNVAGTESLCAAAVAAGARRLVYLSSVGVYGHGTHRDADESTPVRPDTPFSRSKAAAEKRVMEHHRAERLSSTILRHRFVYGEGDESVVPRLIRAARRYPFWVAGGRARISMIWVGDLAEVVCRFATGEGVERPAADDPVFHATSGEALTFRQIVSAIADAFGFRTPRISLPLRPLLALLLLRERMLGLDPETMEGVSSLRLRMMARDNDFANRKLLRRFPDLDFCPFSEGLARSLEFYRRFAEDS